MLVDYVNAEYSFSGNSYIMSSVVLGFRFTSGYLLLFLSLSLFLSFLGYLNGDTV